MCGIAGIWNFNNQPIEKNDLLQFTNSLTHRGPDGYGIFLDPDETIGLGHRRLAILDLSEKGKQPMSYGDGRYWITYNGEIYNFLEIRHQLEKLGHRFHTQTDTEVILAAYVEWGHECQLAFNGMWAFAIWDRLEKVLFLSRDRFGVKPFYFYQTHQQFSFASEMKAFLSLKGFQAKVDYDVMAAALASSWNIESQERCLFSRVKRLLPGHYAIVTPEKLDINRWWNTLENLPEIPQTYQEQTEKFLYLFDDACRIRTRSDVPVTSCLSGGLDSSSIVSTIASKRHSWNESKEVEHTQRAFIATFPGSPNDERAFADLVVNQSQVIPTYCYLDSILNADTINQVLWNSEDIFFNLPIAIWLTYQTVRQHGLYVTMDGHGADELLAGYPQHITAAISANSGIFHPKQTLSLIKILQGVYGQTSQWPQSSPLTLIFHTTPGLAEMYNIAHRITRLPQKVKSLISRSNDDRWLQTNSRLTPGFKDPLSMDDFSLALYQDFHVTVLPTLLRIFDRASMAHGVEVRMPFLDWRLVTYCFALPMTSKLGDGFTKRILRTSMKGIIPEEVRLRKHKIGFASPMQKLFQEQQFTNWVKEIINSDEFVNCELWNSNTIRQFCNQHLLDGTWDYHTAEKIWPYLNAAKWMDIFVNGNIPTQNNAYLNVIKN
ncbi:asparagine synthase (glutamine-hydrolysing) [Nostoc sp. NIES-4103]|nr:asparagine synthase (glutamine-hydrolysing) [Nostoc sp. NIES-4103]